MTVQATLKAPGEKLIRIRLELEAHEVREAAISGDFFIHPEESVSILEEALLGRPGTQEKLLKRLQDAVELGGLELVGISAESIASCALKAYENRKGMENS